ncbi:MAG: hypothetical protein E7254_01535 [Lachnospiraceae bacterium]|nr:hypothetical protein [Lachnospiraceae bacterium]
MGTLKGSQTVEMALVSPIVFITVILVVYMTFYVHDITKIEAGAYSAAISMAYEGEELSQTKANNPVVFIYKKLKWKSDKNTVEIKGEKNISFAIVDNLLGINSVRECVRSESSLNINYLYAFKTLEDMVSKE